MPDIRLPDGSIRSYPQPVSVATVAGDIGAGLARAALAGKVDGRLVDTSHVIDADAELAIVTERDADGVEIIRHSTAHLLAYAVKELFPQAQVTIGPVIDNGFYYDFAYSRPFTPDDLTAIEKRMAELAKRDIPVSREVWARDEAVRFFESQGEKYKAELIAAIPQGEDVSLYREGDFIDLCRGPHLPSTGAVGTAFKLMKVSGAYWRGDAQNEMLHRIYGTCWRDQKELDAYLHMLEEAEKRDHRKIGRDMDLFHLQEEAVGSVFWHDKGYTIYRALENYIRRKIDRAGYKEVKTPQLFDSSLFKASGHWDMYGDNMFKVKDGDDRLLGVKPMNCPAHVQIFNQGLKSYRDLPIRMAEFGCCHRNEPSGAMHGIMRVRQFTQDDAHIFCRDDQVEQEALEYFKLQLGVYKDLGFDNIAVKLALRPGANQRLGSDDVWDRAENGLRNALRGAGPGCRDSQKIEPCRTNATGARSCCSPLIRRRISRGGRCPRTACI